MHDLALGTPALLAQLTAGTLTVDGTLLGFPKAGGSGNPSQTLVSGAVRAVFFDDESKAGADQDLFVREVTGAFPGGPYGDARKLPATIAQAGTSEIQPAFDAGELFFRRDDVILSAKYDGGSFADASSWSAPRKELETGTSTGVGAVRTVGEPNAATRAGKRLLFFVYAIHAPDDTLDLNVGVVEAR